MKTIKPILTAAQKANILGKNVASSAGIIVTSFRRLQLEVAKLSCLNMRYVLDEECMARIGRFPKNRKHFQKVSCFWGNIIIFAAINR